MRARGAHTNRLALLLLVLLLWLLLLLVLMLDAGGGTGFEGPTFGLEKRACRLRHSAPGQERWTPVREL